MTTSPLVVVKRARKLSGACVANAGLAGSWKSGLAAAASLPPAGLSAAFLHAVAAITNAKKKESERIALCYPLAPAFAIVCGLLSGLIMDSWIARRIRATALRRFMAWTLLLIGGVLLATSNHRYIANFLGGPYALTQADLDAIADVGLTSRYFAQVKGERVIDTGIRQYTVHSRNGVETDRSESGAYRALVFGGRFLVVRTAATTESHVAEGKLLPRPADFDAQLFDSKDMRELTANFYPFYLESEPFRKPGYIV